jgi:hypothetical protein
LNKKKFSKTIGSQVAKFYIDLQYFYFIIIFFLFYSILKTIQNFIDIEKNFSFYFNTDHQIKNIEKINYEYVFIFFITHFLFLIIPSIMLRFCVRSVLFKTQIKVQRFFSFFLSVILIITTRNDGLIFGEHSYLSEFFLNLSKIINLLFLGFFIISFFILFLNIKEKFIDKKIKIFLIFLSLFFYLFYDFKKTRNFRSESKNNIENSELIFVLEKNEDTKDHLFKENSEYKYIKKNFKIKEETISLVSNNNLSNYIAFLTGLFPFDSRIRNNYPNESSLNSVKNYIQKYKKKENYIYISNISEPSALGKVFKGFDGGVHCDNNIESIYYYNLIQNINPILIFFSKKFILKYLQKSLCIIKKENLKKYITEDIYYGMNLNKNKEKKIVSFIKKDYNISEIIDIIENINETLETDKIRIKIIIFDKKNIVSKIFSLSKEKVLESENSINITKYSENFIEKKESDIIFDYQEEIPEKYIFKNLEIIDNRVSYNFSYEMNFLEELRKIYACNMKEEKSQTLGTYEKISSKIPQIILIKNNQKQNNKCLRTIEENFEKDYLIFLNQNSFKKIFNFYSEKK